MTSTDRAAQIANSVWLTLLGRLSMAAFMPLLLVAWLYLDGRFAAIDARADTAASTADSASAGVSALATRMTIVEVNMDNGRRKRDEQFAALTLLITDMQRTQTTMLQAIATLQATVEALRRPSAP